MKAEDEGLASKPLSFFRLSFILETYGAHEQGFVLTRFDTLMNAVRRSVVRRLSIMAAAGGQLGAQVRAWPMTFGRRVCADRNDGHRRRAV